MFNVSHALERRIERSIRGDILDDCELDGFGVLGDQRVFKDFGDGRLSANGDTGSVAGFEGDEEDAETYESCCACDLEVVRYIMR